MIEQELHKNAAVITKVSETASKEFAIESALDKMQGAWSAVKLVIEEYRETGRCRKPVIKCVLERTCCPLIAIAVIFFRTLYHTPVRWVCF